MVLGVVVVVDDDADDVEFVELDDDVPDSDFVEVEDSLLVDAVDFVFASARLSVR